jgi:hypothetical protein
MMMALMAMMDDDVLNDCLDDYGVDGEGELRCEVLWAWNRRKLDYARAKIMISMMASVMMASMIMVSMERMS